MTRGLIAVAAGRGRALAELFGGYVLCQRMGAPMYDASLRNIEWEAQRVQSACEKALAGGAPRDPRTGQRGELEGDG